MNVEARVRVLLVDDDPDDWLLTRGALLDAAPTRYEMTWAPTYEEGLEQLLGGTHDIGLLDYRLGARNGLALLRELAENGSRAPLILLTGVGDPEVDEVAVRAGAADYLIKGRFDGELLDRSIRYALERRRGEERAIEVARAQAAQSEAEANRSQLQHLLATISHDLQQPLTAIRGRAELLIRRLEKAEGGDPRVQEGVTQIAATAVRMSDLLRELVNASRDEALGEAGLERSPTDLVGVARRAMESAREGAPNHHFSLVSPEETIIGEWDPAALDRVVGNLLSNAAKYSADDTDIAVEIALEVEGEVKWAVLSVRDQGLGIPAADMAHVFQPFRRGSNVDTIAGTGIGLASAREIVERHGGAIAVDSQEGQGTCFTVRLPLH